jgi:hypothetical protein
VKGELRADSHRELSGKLASDDLNPGEESFDLRAERRVDPFLHRRLKVQPGKAGCKLDECADGDGDVAGLLGGRGTEEEEENAGEGFEALKGEKGSGRLAGVERERRKAERGEGVVEEDIYVGRG